MSSSFAGRHFADGQALGKRVRLGSRRARARIRCGVVADTRTRPEGSRRPSVFSIGRPNRGRINAAGRQPARLAMRPGANRRDRTRHHTRASHYSNRPPIATPGRIGAGIRGRICDRSAALAAAGLAPSAPTPFARTHGSVRMALGGSRECQADGAARARDCGPRLALGMYHAAIIAYSMRASSRNDSRSIRSYLVADRPLPANECWRPYIHRRATRVDRPVRAARVAALRFRVQLRLWAWAFGSGFRLRASGLPARLPDLRLRRDALEIESLLRQRPPP